MQLHGLIPILARRRRRPETAWNETGNGRLGKHGIRPRCPCPRRAASVACAGEMKTISKSRGAAMPRASPPGPSRSPQIRKHGVRAHAGPSPARGDRCGCNRRQRPRISCKRSSATHFFLSANIGRCRGRCRRLILAGASVGAVQLRSHGYGLDGRHPGGADAGGVS